MLKKIIQAIIIIILILPIHIKAIDTSATSAILMDMDSKRILYAKNIHNVRSVASISKIMTALLAVESGKLQDKVTVGKEIESSHGSGIYIKEGEILTLNDLLYGLMLRSGNDASYAIAKYVGKDVNSFVNMMNEKAQLLQMKNTTFHNPNGLDEIDGNFSTAYDIALLTSEAMKHSEYRKIVGTKQYKLKTNMNVYSWTNKHRLVKSYKYATGGKTGYTLKARRTLVTTASKNHLNLVVVTLNDGNDFKDHKDLFEYAFSNYKSYEILSKGNIQILDDNYYKKYDLYVKNSFTYPLSDNEKDSIIVKFELEKNRTIKKNKQVGVAKVYLGDQMIHEEKIYVKEKKQKKTFSQKIKEWFHD